MKLKEDESHITKNWGGAMLVKIVILLWQILSHITKFLISQMGNGGDVDENRHFIEGKWVAHYQKLRGAMLVKIVILFWHNWSHITKFRISQMGNIQKCSALRAIIC